MLVVLERAAGRIGDAAGGRLRWLLVFGRGDYGCSILAGYNQQVGMAAGAAVAVRAASAIQKIGSAF
jgi:hypothetical protein